MNERGSLTDPPGVLRRRRSEKEESNSSTHSTQESATAGNDDMDRMAAKRVIRDYIDEGGELPSLLARAPQELTKAAREIWCARQILAAKEAS